MNSPPTIHASAVLIGPKAALIRGPAGSGKSRLVWDLLQAAAQGALPFARLVADDRAYVEACAGRLLVRPAPALAGMIEIRGLGIRRLPYRAAGGGRAGGRSGGRGCRPPSGPGDRPNRHCRGQPAAASRRSRNAGPAAGVGFPAGHRPPAIDLGPASGLTPTPAVRLKKLTITGLGSPPPKRTPPSPPWPHLSAVQQSAYIARQALATGLRMGLNAPPFVRRNVAPARSSG